MKIYTVAIVNEALQSARYCGTFHSIDAATDFMVKEARRACSFVTYRAHYGTPKNPGAATGPVYRGEQ